MKTHVDIPAGIKVAWAPSPGPQTEALLCDADELLYGGAAGGGKSDYLVIAALEDAHQRGYKAVIFRRTYPELESSVIDRARALIPTIKGLEGASENTSKHEWKFRTGARLLFRHMEDDAAAVAHRSTEYQYVGFDELTTFTERQYKYLFSRLRTSQGLRCRMRSASNPGGVGHAWVKKRWAPWLDAKCKTQAVSGEVLWFVTNLDTGEDIYVPRGTPGALSRCFIGAKLEDNPHIDKRYEHRLNTLDPLTRKQLRSGDWDATPAPKDFFNREWAPKVPSAPGDVRSVRGWDRAATEQQGSNDPDWTAGVKVGYSETTQLFYIMHVRRLRAGPGGVKSAVLSTARADGVDTWQALPCDPASAGVFEAAEWLNVLIGFVVDVARETGDKVTRAKVWSAHFAPSPGEQFGKFRVVDGDWNDDYLTELENFPTPKMHDDQVDATSTAFRVLIEGGGGSAISQDDLRLAGIKEEQEQEDDDYGTRQAQRGPSFGGGYRW